MLKHDWFQHVLFYLGEINMKLKICVFAGLLAQSVMVNANDQLALQTVKNIYEMGKSLEKGNEIIALYADQKLSRAIEVWNAAEYCVGYDVMWQSNDPPYHRKVTYTPLANNQVKVNLAKVPYYDAASLTYKMSCAGNTCKIADIVDQFGSLKNNIAQECR